MPKTSVRSKALYGSSIAKRSPKRTKTDWNRLRTLTDRDIDRAVRADPDAAEPLDSNFWKKAHLVAPEPKVPVSLRVDKDVLEFFRAQGSGYQTKMNAVLRSYVEHKKRA